MVSRDRTDDHVELGGFFQGPARAWLVAAGVVLIAYLTLFPLSGWQWPQHGWWELDMELFWHPSGGDVLANVLLYFPLGFVYALGQRRRLPVAVLLLALALSLALETAQACLLGRVSSLLDTSLNVLGAALGALATPLLRWAGGVLSEAERMRLRRDHVAWFGLAALALWLVAQLVPFVPSLDVSNLKAGLKPVWQLLQGQASIGLWRLGLYVAALVMLTATGANVLERRRWGFWVALGLLAVLPLRVMVVGRQLSPEALIGTLLGVALGGLLWRAHRRRALLLAWLLVPLYLAASALRPGAAGSVLHAFDWIPLHAQITNPINGLANLTDSLWPLAVFAFALRRLGARSLWLWWLWVTLGLALLEALQGLVPGRYPDITTVLSGSVAWAVAAWWNRAGLTASTRPAMRPRR